MKKRVVRVKRRVVRRKEDLSVEQLTTLAPPAGVWEKINAFLEECNKKGGRALRSFIINRYQEVFDEEPKKGASIELLKGAVGRQLQYEGFRDYDCLSLLSPKFKTNLVASRELDENKLTPDTRSLLHIAADARGTEGDITMATRKKAKKGNGAVGRGFSGKRWGLSIHETLIRLLQENEKAPKGKKKTDAVLLKFLETEFPKSATWKKNGDVKLRSIRAKYNRGHETGGVVPKTQSFEYDNKGNKVEARRGKKKGKTTKKKVATTAKSRATRKVRVRRKAA